MGVVVIPVWLRLTRDLFVSFVTDYCPSDRADGSSNQGAFASSIFLIADYTADRSSCNTSDESTPLGIRVTARLLEQLGRRATRPTQP